VVLCRLIVFVFWCGIGSFSVRLYICEDFQWFIFILFALHDIFFIILCVCVCVCLCVCVCNKACHIYTLEMCLK